MSDFPSMKICDPDQGWIKHLDSVWAALDVFSIIQDVHCPLTWRERSQSISSKMGESKEFVRAQIEAAGQY